MAVLNTRRIIIQQYSSMLFLIFVILVSCSLVNADDPFWSGENDPVWNEYGIVKCWYSKNNSSWDEATVNSAELKLGEPFYVKVIIKASKDLNAMSFQLSGLGSSAKEDFEILKEPFNLADNAEIVDMQHSLIELTIYKPIKNETHEYIWKIRVKPDSDWAGGNSPLNVDVQFTKDGNHILPPFTLVNVNILTEFWNGYTEDNNDNVNKNDDNSNDGTPGFEISSAFLTIALLVLYKQKNNQKSSYCTFVILAKYYVLHLLTNLRIFSIFSSSAIFILNFIVVC
jgi:hypothetical protein